MPSSSLRINLRNISSGNRLSSIKQRLNTCFQDIRTKLIKQEPHKVEKSNQNKEKKFFESCGGHNNFFKFLSARKVKKKSRIFSEESEDNNSPDTFLLKSPSKTSVTETDKMTIDAMQYQDIHEDYPYLDTEVRGILLTRAQYGATIADVRDDYQKLTGEKFPITSNVTDYLLSIPNVSVHCNAAGTRIFNILPTEKNQHLHDLIINQKTVIPTKSNYQANLRHYNRQQQQQRQLQQNCINNWHHVDNDSWAIDNNNCDFDIDPNNNYTSNNNNNCKKNNNANYIKQIMPQMNDKSSQCGSDSGIHESNNCFFEDNYNYLLNRFQPHYNNQRHNGNTGPAPTTSLMEFEKISNSNQHQNQPTIPYQQKFHHQQEQLLLPQSSSRRTSLSTNTARNSQFHDSVPINDLDSGAQLFDFLLLGDDFFLHFARTELKCKFASGERVLQSGLCVSGQTIPAAIKRIRQMGCTNRQMIINIGSADILKGKPLVEIEHEFKQLLTLLEQRGITPILTTLAPLANYLHVPEIKNNVERFNQFIKRQRYRATVIDIWSCMVNGQKTLFDCYQKQPRQVTGGPEQYLFWNNIGRQRILQLIASHIEY